MLFIKSTKQTFDKLHRLGKSFEDFTDTVQVTVEQMFIDISINKHWDEHWVTAPHSYGQVDVFKYGRLRFGSALQDLWKVAN